MYWAQNGSGGGVLFDPETTNWCLCIYVAPMPQPTGNAITLSPFRRPTAESAPVDAKAACLYPNNSRALIEAQTRGFSNCLLLDMLGNVAEFGNSNVFMAQGRRGLYAGAERNLPQRHHAAAGDRSAARRRRHGGRDDAELCRISCGADEIFSSGNFAKVAPVIRIDDRSLQPGPFYQPGAQTVLGLCPR